jgi:hypothetical protein
MPSVLLPFVVLTQNYTLQIFRGADFVLTDDDRVLELGEGQGLSSVAIY